MQDFNLWNSVGTKCLNLANGILEKETAPTAATVETVTKLVGIAIQIDVLNLRREAQNRSFSAALRDPLSGLREGQSGFTSSAE